MSSIQTSRVQRESALAARLLELPATASNFAEAEDIFLADKCQGYVDVLKDLLRCDAQQAVGRFNEVVSSAARMPTAERVGESEVGAELFCVDQEPGAVCLPVCCFHAACQSGWIVENEFCPVPKL